MIYEFRLNDQDYNAELSRVDGLYTYYDYILVNKDKTSNFAQEFSFSKFSSSISFRGQTRKTQVNAFLSGKQRRTGVSGSVEGTNILTVSYANSRTYKFVPEAWMST